MVRQHGLALVNTVREVQHIAGSKEPACRPTGEMLSS
jgi:hypothetical protein